MKYVPTWFPGAGFKKVAFNARKSLHENAEAPFQLSIQEMVMSDVFNIQLTYTVLLSQARGTAQPSVVSKNMENTSMTELETDLLKWAASSLFSGMFIFLRSPYDSSLLVRA